MSEIVALSHVTKEFRRGSETIHALRDVTLSAREGEFIAILGPSGSGKTTLLNLIGCMDKPDAGSLRITGQETAGLGERELTAIRSRQIGFVFQQFFLLPTLTAIENVQLPAVFSHNGARRERAAELLDRVHLGGREAHRPSQLSGGEMQRVAIARALINSPRILLADEPTGSLDSQTAGGILGLFRELNTTGLTVFLVTHNDQLAAECHRTIRLRDGAVAE